MNRFSRSHLADQPGQAPYQVVTGIVGTLCQEAVALGVGIGGGPEVQAELNGIC